MALRVAAAEAEELVVALAEVELVGEGFGDSVLVLDLVLLTERDAVLDERGEDEAVLDAV